MLIKTVLQAIMSGAFLFGISRILYEKTIDTLPGWIWERQFLCFSDFFKNAFGQFYYDNEIVFKGIAGAIPFALAILSAIVILLLTEVIYHYLAAILLKLKERYSFQLILVSSIRKWNAFWYLISLFFIFGFIILLIIYLYPELIYYILIYSIGLASFLMIPILGFRLVYYIAVVITLTIFAMILTYKPKGIV